MSTTMQVYVVIPAHDRPRGSHQIGLGRAGRFVAFSPGMVPGPSAVRDQLARRVAGWRT
jgi:hypothetical protein